ncbi:transporter substrate-binding domain-containing protein [Calothrix sp. CCY 0018]|uniref:transporter substrate-binding domain-containing protein n=1 Tax=Calothrix sp. CCY 0018 TaxID=3103864 RepID=UPI0039C6A781
MIDWLRLRLIYRQNRQCNPQRMSHLLLSAAMILCLTCLFLNVGTSPVFAASLKEIQQRGYINVAVKDNFPPLAFRDESGNLQGFEIEIAQRLAKDLLAKPDSNNSDKLDKLIKLKPVTNLQRLKVVEKGEVDMAIAKVTATPSRERIVNFSIPYYLDGGFIAIKNTSFQKLTDLQNSKIAVLKNSSTIAPLRYYLPEADLIGVKSYLEGQRLLENNRVSAFAADVTSLSNWLKQNPQYRLLSSKISTQPLSVVMPKGLEYDELRRQVSQLIGSYLESGWLKQRAEYWGLPMNNYQ